VKEAPVEQKTTEPDHHFTTKLEVFEWLKENTSPEWLAEQHVKSHKNQSMNRLLDVYRLAKSNPTTGMKYQHAYVEGGTNVYSLNADTFFSIVMQLDDLIDFIVCERVCRAWNQNLKETRLWRGAVVNFALEGQKWSQLQQWEIDKLEERIESLGRKYVGDYQAVFFDQLKLWGKPLQSNATSAVLVQACEHMSFEGVKRALENGTDATFPAGQSSHGTIRTPLQAWFSKVTAIQDQRNNYRIPSGYHPGDIVKISREQSAVLELLITKGGLDIFRYVLPRGTFLELEAFNWRTQAQFESGRTCEELEAMIANYHPIPYSLRGWRLYRESLKKRGPLKFNLK
jgi:hypothetical protein